MLQKAGVEFANKICKNDPVRPNLPIGWRVAPCSREVFYLPFTYYSTSEDRYHESADAVLCVAHLNEIPINEDELLSFEYGNISIFCYLWVDPVEYENYVAVSTRTKEFNDWLNNLE